MTNGNGDPGGRAGGSRASEAPLEARRYLAALGRNRFLILAIIGTVTAIVAFLSLILPKSYQASATIVLDASQSVLGPPDPVTVQRSLETADALITSVNVLDAAVEELPGESSGSIESAISSTVDPDANLITITAAKPDPEDASAVANAVATAFLDEQEALERERFAQAKQNLTAQLNQLRTDPAATPEQVEALQARISALSVEEATAGSQLQLAEPATTPSAPASPKPFRNIILALFASAFLAVLVALGREQLRPGVAEPRELSRLFGEPILASIPFIRQRNFGRRRHLVSSVERELYQNLAATVQLMMPPKGDIILVTSATQGEGKTTVANRLGRALAQAGNRTLLISADLRLPTLHRHFDIPPGPGLTDALALMERAGVSDHLISNSAHGIAVNEPGAAREAILDVVPSGSSTSEPARALSEESLRRLFTHLRGLDYDYILLDGPPMLGVAEAQPLARLSDRVFLVARPARLSLETVVDVEELLDRVGANTLGLVVIGGRTDLSVYYGSTRPGVVNPPGEEPTREGSRAERES